MRFLSDSCPATQGFHAHDEPEIVPSGTHGHTLAATMYGDAA